jgi:hypothetical protein
MCPCSTSAPLFADALYRCPAPLRKRVQTAAGRHPQYFESEMLELSFEDFQSGHDGYYRCSQCLQWWFLLFADEECPGPIFGVRSSEEARRSVVLRATVDADVQRSRAFVLELLFGASRMQLCANAGCDLPALEGLALCAEHYSFPW